VLSAPRRLFAAPIFGGPARLNMWDVSDDGKRFLVLTNLDARTDTGSVTLIINWPSLLKK
jgi:hypothetical protein